MKIVCFLGPWTLIHISLIINTLWTKVHGPMHQKK